MPNRLASETSPYLLQHADNPVDWYPWGPEALERAKEEDRPILLSVGYSACHWCHVMERESFEDEQVAALMNETFVNVKVDREERPDVDAVYMRAVQALTGRGGWPLTAFLTPEAKPYYGGTYFPPEPRHGMPSFPQVLRAARDAWENRRDEVTKAAGEITELLERSGRPGGAARRADQGDDGPPPELSPELVAHARAALAARYDGALGGFGSAPKFPQPPTLEFLLRHHQATGHEHALEMALETLRAMARGGIRDHLGGGFHRYSVDARWLVPHFEKMLYDNALLLRVYLHAWQLTGDDELRRVVEDTARWLLEDMRSPEGGFYSARDADSEGEEGLYYVWTPDEIADALGTGEANLFQRVYGVTATGNFEGRNILHLPRPLPAAAADLGMELDALLERIEGWREALLDVRVEREPPLRDEKILAGWNGMTVRALAEAGGALERADWIEAAGEGLRWLLDVLRPEGPGGPLLHVHTAGRSAVPAFLEDVAALGNAALTLHEVTLDPTWLDEARRLGKRCVDDFWAEDEGVFYDTAHDAEALVVRPREPMDNATPAGGSLAAELLLRTGHLFGEDRLTGIGRRAVEGESRSMAAYPSAFGRLLSVTQGMLDVPVELALVGEPDDPATRALLRPFLAAYLPGRTVVGRAPGTPIPEDIPLLAGREPGTDDDGRPVPTAWLCRSYTCLRPVTTPEGLRKVMEETTATSGEASGLPGG